MKELIFDNKCVHCGSSAKPGAHVFLAAAGKAKVLEKGKASVESDVAMTCEPCILRISTGQEEVPDESTH